MGIVDLYISSSSNPRSVNIIYTNKDDNVFEPTFDEIILAGSAADNSIRTIGDGYMSSWFKSSKIEISPDEYAVGWTNNQLPPGTTPGKDNIGAFTDEGKNYYEVTSDLIPIPPKVWGNTPLGDQTPINRYTPAPTLEDNPKGYVLDHPRALPS